MRPGRIVILAAAAVAWASSALAWSFGVVGDTRGDRHDVFPRVLAAVAESDMEFLVHTGDLEHEGGVKAWEAFRKRTAGFQKPLHVVIGNHEVRGATPREFADFFGLPGSWYSFAHKNAFFVVLDNARGRFPAGTLDWLDRELSKHPKGNGTRHLVVAMHAPPKTDSIAPHGMDKRYGEQSERLLGILSRHKVDLVLCSHEHMHVVDEWNGIRVIVSGGGGAPMFPFQRYGFYRVEFAPDGTVRETLVTIPAQTPAAAGK